MIRVELTKEVVEALHAQISQVRDDGQHIVLTYKGEGLLALIPMDDLALYYDLEDRAEMPLVEKNLTEPGAPILIENFEKTPGT